MPADIFQMNGRSLTRAGRLLRGACSQGFLPPLPWNPRNTPRAAARQGRFCSRTVRLSVSRSPAIAVTPRASSSSRNASSPASEVTVAPWNSSFSRRSNATRNPVPSASPVASSIRRALHDRQTLAAHSPHGRCVHQPTRSSGKCGIKRKAPGTECNSGGLIRVRPGCGAGRAFLHHAAHAATRHRGRAAALLRRLLGHHRLGGEKQAGNRGRVL